MSYQLDDDHLMDPVLLQQQIQVGVGETAGAPMFLSDDLARCRYAFSADFAASGPEFEGLTLPRTGLYGRDIRPCLLVARTVAVMHGVEHAQLGLPRGI